MSRGRLEFDAHNGMLFIAEPPPPKGGYCKCYKPECQKEHCAADSDREGPSHMLEWKTTPAAFAKALRKAADWLDKHADNPMIRVDID